MSNHQDAFAKNRAEELGYDVWNDFVIPHFYNELDFLVATKPRVIVGGRGCGKTMLIRYLSHQSSFSKHREDFPEDCVEHIGLYWRADTQFCNALIKRGIDEETWSSAFKHFVALGVSKEMIDSLINIAESKYPNFSESQIDQISVESLAPYFETVPASLRDLLEYLTVKMREFELWVNNVKKISEPMFLPGVSFLKSIIDLIKKDCKELSDTNFYVYVDEYENLANYQQRIINDWLKHSERPLIFNLAVKKNAFIERETTGNERLANIHDYRRFDLEELLLRDKFEVFAAEIFFLKLARVGIANLPIDTNILRSIDNLKERKNSAYQKKVVDSVQKILPDIPLATLAQAALDDKAIYSEHLKKLKQALASRGIENDTSEFLCKKNSEATIVIPALLNRKINTQDILDEISALRLGNDNKFTGRTGWIHNNFVGAFLQLYAPFSRPCPFYSGFKTFCSLSRGNVRHFLELCHKSIGSSFVSLRPIDSVLQAEAARRTSASFLAEIKSFGPCGNKMHTFVLRLGSLFGLSHRRPSLSEPEQNHFVIKKYSGDTDSIHEMLNEACKWSVLFENKETKKKVEMTETTVEYILNPIYAPYFYISYRKKRRIEFSLSDIKTIIEGSFDDFHHLMTSYNIKWSIDSSASEVHTLSLFGSDS